MSSNESLLASATRLALAPARLGVGLGGEAVRAGRELQRAAAGAGERGLVALIDTIVARVLDDEVIDRVLDRVEAAGLAQHVVDRILEDGVMEQIADRLLAGPELERMLAAAFRSALPDELIAQALASEAVWVLVDEIARSPSVTEAIAHQGTGFLEQVAAKTRDRSRQADSRVQRLAERFSRQRRSSKASPEGGAIPPPHQLPDRSGQ
jgi:uncharacterized membrane-anchored protein YjiN (DUF445 family)